MVALDNRHPIRVDLNKQSLLVRMTYPAQFDGILRRADRENVHSVWNWLNNRFFDTYLGGGVIGRLLEGRDGKYKDIDFLAGYDEIGRFDQLGKYLGHHDGGEIEMGRRKFVVNRTSKNPYLNFNGVENFVFSPSPNFFDSQSPIDISFKYNRPITLR